MSRIRAPQVWGIQPRGVRTRALRAGRLLATGARPVASVCLYTCSSNPSGMGVHMLALARCLVASGVRVSVAYWPASATEALVSRAQSYGATLLRTPHPRDPAYARELTEGFRFLEPDVVHVHVGTGREDFGGARAARAAGVPAVVETLHLPWMMRDRRKQQRFLASLDAVDRLIAVSDGLRRSYERIGVPAARFATVPNGVVPRSAPLGREGARRRLDIAPDRPVVMAVGRLHVQKGHRDLVAALPALVADHPDVMVLIAGSGPLGVPLERQAAQLGVAPALRLLGHRPDAAQLLDAADVFVLPSRQEGMPMAVLEAMDSGLPVVATRVVGTAEVLGDGGFGALVSPGNASQLAAALSRLLADEGLRRRMGAQATAAFESRYTAARMTAATIAVYDEVLAQRSTAGRLAAVEG